MLGMMGPALCTGLIPLAGCNRVIVIFLLIAAMAFLGMCGGGHVTITADMAPHHSATLFGLVNGIGCTAGIFSPMLAGILLEDAHSSIHQWSLIFYISAGFYVIGGIIFLLFASGERQPWAYIPDVDKLLNGALIQQSNGIYTNHPIVKSKWDIDSKPNYGSLS